jgi:hypothetical protein
VLQGLKHSLAAESVQRPKEDRIELATGGGSEHFLELVSIGTLSTYTVFVLVHDCPVLLGAELSQLAQLVLRVLLVSGADSGVEGDLQELHYIRTYVHA